MSDTTLPINYTLKGRYSILRFLGGGKMGGVYLAHDLLSNNDVAVKQSLRSDKEELRRQFIREAQLLYQLYHRGLPKVIDYFVERNDQYMVMSYVPGKNLRELFDASSEPFGVSQVLNWADQLLEILEYLHGQPDPVVHRDIKPQNIKVADNGQVYLLDFGIAKGNLRDVTQLSPGFTLLGWTDDYSPLEQTLRADESLRNVISPLLTDEEKGLYINSFTDPRVDLYSLSATLYFLLTGQKSPSAATRITALKYKQPNPMKLASEVRREIPEHVSDCLQRGMELDPRLRFRSAAEMRQTLTGVEESETFVRPRKKNGPMRARLLWLEGGTVFPLDEDEIIIGRETGQIRFSDVSVSGRHARLLRTGEGFVVADENSKNGIYKLIADDTVLSDGDEILLGELQFKVVRKSPDSLELHHVVTDNIFDYIYTFNAPTTTIGTGSGMYRFSGLDDHDLDAPQAQVVQDAGTFKLIDVNHTNSNYKRIVGRAALNDGDILLIGMNVLRYEIVFD